MSASEGVIAKFLVRFRVDVNPLAENATLDERIVEHLRSLDAFGGSAEWLRSAVRNQFIKEQEILAASEDSPHA